MSALRTAAAFAVPIALVLAGLWGVERLTAAPQPPTVRLIPTALAVGPGSALTLSWEASGAKRCIAAGGWRGERPVGYGRESVAIEGAQSYVLDCTGDGGTTRARILIDANSPEGAFPLQSTRGARYLLDVRGRPFLLVGDSPWDLIASLRDEEVDRYLDDRRAKGFNALLVELMERFFSPKAPNDVYGTAPLLTPGDFQRPNDRYFDRAVRIIRKAQAHGMTVLLTPAYMGYHGGKEGWYREMRAAGPEVMRAWGAYVARRFAECPNVIWVQGGDFNPPEAELINAVAEGIASISPSALQTIHGSRFTAALEVVRPPPPWLSLNAIYADDRTIPWAARRQYVRSTLPFILIEGQYEDERLPAAAVRLQAYQTLLGGGTGQMMGNTPVWLFGAGWAAALDSPGAQSMRYFRQFFQSVEWWKLRPDPSDGNRAVAQDRSFEVRYAPSGRAYVALAALAGPHVSAHWYDPSSGAYRAVAGFPRAAAGYATLEARSLNAEGASDWLLLLESTP